MKGYDTNLFYIDDELRSYSVNVILLYQRGGTERNNGRGRNNNSARWNNTVNRHTQGTLMTMMYCNLYVIRSGRCSMWSTSRGIQRYYQWQGGWIECLDIRLYRSDLGRSQIYVAIFLWVFKNDQHHISNLILKSENEIWSNIYFHKSQI